MKPETITLLRKYSKIVGLTCPGMRNIFKSIGKDKKHTLIKQMKGAVLAHKQQVFEKQRRKIK